MENTQAIKIVLLSESAPTKDTLLHLTLGFNVKVAFDQNDVIDIITDHNAKLLIIDCTALVGATDIIKKYRRILSIPIMVVLNVYAPLEKEKENINLALKCGADDVVSLPIERPLFEAKLFALMRMQLVTQKTPTEYSRVFDLGNGSEFCYSDQRITLENKKEIHLTKKEAGIILLFLSNIDLVITHEALIIDVWQSKFADNFTIRSMNVYIVRVRKLLKEANSIYMLTNIHGRGYRMINTQINTI